VAAGYLADERHGPLPALLLVLTFTTGLIDAMSVLGLGRVFVANMTGNIVFLGLALAQVPGFSVPLTLASVIGFLAGGLAGGSISRRSANRGVALRTSCLVQLVLIVIALVVAAATGPRHLPWAAEAAVVSLCAVAMGLQNAMTQHLGVPELATNVLTSTLTRMAADGHRLPAHTSRRVLSVVSLFLGASVGALLVLHLSLVAPLATVAALEAGVLGWCARDVRRGRAWITAA